ncbi:MAG TPA: VWA domain-containing protein [Pseudonocardiaceae bacterium]|nr:VWA domain-containing protein [Pseudonocardiaceae bacterium]
MTLAQGAAAALNKILLDLCIWSTKEVGGAVRHYFDIGIFGYGACPIAQTEGVESAFSGPLAGQSLVPLSVLADNPVAVREAPSVDIGAGHARIPVWVEPVHGYRTPMCQAIATAGAHVFDWAGQHPASFPPIVINITDGMVTDSPHDGATLDEWAKRLTTIETNDGAALLLNIFLSPSPCHGVLYPVSPVGLPEPGPELFSISSPLPQKMINNANAAGVPAQPGARALGFNADLAMLLRFLEIGTRPTEILDR